jgi:putative copper resistance protein D
VIVDRALLEWPLVVATVVTFGTAAFVLLSAGSGRDDLSAVMACALPIWRLLAVVTVLVSPFILVNVTADMATVSWAGALPLVPEVLAQTHAGRVWEWLLPTALLFLLVAYIPIRQSIRARMVFVLAGVLLFLQALLSHAIGKGVFAVTVYFVHEVAAGLWVGALLVLWIVALRGNAPEVWIVDAAQRVSKLAFWSVLAIVISGVYAAYNGLGFDMYHLLYSAYGRTLIAKVAVFAAVLALGGYNRYWLVPKVNDSTALDGLLYNVGVESIILLFGVLGLASLLANTPPAHGPGGQAGHSMMAMFIAEPRRRRLRRLQQEHYARSTPEQQSSLNRPYNEHSARGRDKHSVAQILHHVICTVRYVLAIPSKPSPKSSAR